MNPWLLTAWLACQAFDEGTTHYALRQGYSEGNPVMQHARLPIKVSVNLAGLLWYKQTKRKTFPVLLTVAGCAGGSWNTYQLMRR